MRSICHQIVSGSVVVLLCGVATGTEQTDPHRASSLFLRAGTINTDAEPNLLADADGPLDPDGRYVLQLDGPMTPARRTALSATGAQIGPYLPMNAYVVRLDDPAVAELAQLGFVRWLGWYRSEWRLDPTIGQRPFVTAARIAQRAAGRSQLVVSYFDDVDSVTVLAELTQRGATVMHDSRDEDGRPGVRGKTASRMVSVVTDLDRVAELREIDGVLFIEEAPELSRRNDTNEWVIQSNQLDQTPIWDQGLHGEGQVGGHIDWPVNVEHCVFADEVEIGPGHRKVVGYRGALGSDAHGTHVAGTYVGDSGTWGVADFRDGIAFAARLSYSSAPDININPESLFDRLLDAQNDGAGVHSNSWGDDSTTEYTTWSEQVDRFTWQNEDALVVFAVTNGSSLKSPENAKNLLAVAASGDTPDENDHCIGGGGPTDDGRRKPDILAPGCGTWSASSFTECDWRSVTGTSYACPLIAGSGLLARQYYMEGFYPSGEATIGDEMTPSGALLKATLLNAARDMTGIEGYPSDGEGWGRLLLDDSLYFRQDARTLFITDVRNADGLSTGDAMSYPIEVLTDSEPLRVTLVWTDAPATMGTAFAPVNDLDLVVVAPDGTTYRGNHFADGQSDEGGDADAINNVEQVHRTMPTRGTYTVTVEATAVNVDTQGFALVVTGDLETGARAPECPGDVNQDGLVDGLDVFTVLGSFCNQPPCDALLDANGDGVINPLDVGFILARLDTCP
ncbi:MAG: S8 family serine peptidase [Planctomycetes bacterium]|nr:S8 family serine peptidase [Planctomycetota bacterium]